MPNLDSYINDSDFDNVPILDRLIQDDGFTDAPLDQQTILNQDNGRIIQAPYGTEPDKAIYLDETDNLKKPQENFYGYVPIDPNQSFFSRLGEVAEKTYDEVTELFTAVRRGIYTTGVSLGTDAAESIRKQYADSYISTLKGENYDTPLAWVNPLSLARNAARINAKFARTALTEQQQQQGIQRSERMIRSANRIRNNYENWLKSTEIGKTDDPVEQFLFDLGGGAATMSASVGLGLITKNPIASITFLALAQKNSAYIEAKNEGWSPQAADSISSLMGAVEGGLELVGFDKLMQVVQGDRILKNILKGAVIEFFQEAAQTGAEETIAQVSDLRETDISGGLQRSLYAGLVGFVSGAGVSATVQTMMKNGSTEKQAQDLYTFIEKNSDKIEERVSKVLDDEASKFDTNDPTVKKTAKLFERFVKGEDIDVRAELDEIQTLSSEQKQKIIDTIEGRGAPAAQQAAIDTAKGRVKFLEREISHIDEQWDRIETEISEQQIARQQELQTQLDTLNAERDQRITDKKPIKAIDNKIARVNEEFESLPALAQSREVETKELTDRRDALEEELANILTIENQDQQKEVLRQALQGEILTKGKKLAGLGLKVSQERVSAAKEAMRRGLKVGKQDIISVQALVSDIITKSGLPPAQQKKFMSKIRNLLTAERATNALPEIYRRIDKEIRQYQRRELKGLIGKTLDKMSPEKRGARPIGKTDDAEMQRLFDIMNAANKMSNEQAAEKLNSNISGKTTDQSDLETLFENKILTLKSGQNISSEDLADFALDINTLVKGTKAATKESSVKRKQQVNEIRARMIQQLLKGKDIDDFNDKSFLQKMIDIAMTVRSVDLAATASWEGFIDVPFGRDEALSKKLISMVSDGMRKERSLSTRYRQQVSSAMATAFGLKSNRAVHKKMIEDEKFVVLDSFIRAGETKAKPWKLSRSQARTLWMQLKSPRLRETLTAPVKRTDDGKMGNGITPEMELALEEFLDATDKNYAEKQFEIYREMYNEVNEVYRRMYGIDLPFETFYSPVSREHQQDLVDVDDFMTGLHEQAVSGIPSLVKSRQQTYRTIKEISDTQVIGKYIQGMSHFVAMAETNRDLNQIFSNTEVQEAIEKTWGKTYADSLKAYLKDFTRGHVEAAGAVAKLFEQFNINVSKALIYGKPNAWIKQLTGAVGYMSELPPKDFLIGVADFLVNYRKAIDIMSNTDLMKNRHGDANIEMMKSNVEKVATSWLGRANVTFDKYMQLATVLGDRSAIYLGGWSVYKYHRDVLGKSHEEAIQAFEIATDKTQQPTRIDMRSRAQLNPNPLVRATVMFLSHPLQMLRVERAAFRKMVRGQMSIAEATKIIAVYHVIAPVLFQYVANAFDGDDDEGSLTRAAILGPLNAYPILGDVMNTWLASLWGLQYGKSQNARGALIIVQEAGKMWGNIAKDGLQLEDIIYPISLMSGRPLQAIQNEIEGVIDINEGETEKGLKRAFGWTEKQTEKSMD